MYQYQSLTAALADLQQRGFVHDFDMKDGRIECEEAFAVLQPGDFQVEEEHRFGLEGDEAPHAVVYAINSSLG